MEKYIWENLPLPACILDKRMKIRDVNAAFCEWVAKAPADLHELSLKDVLALNEQPIIAKNNPTIKATILKKTVLPEGETLFFFSLGSIEESLSKEIEKLSLVAKYTTNAVIITNAQGYTEWVNYGCEMMTGYRLSDFLGKKPGQLLQGPLTDKETVARIREKLRQQIPFEEKILNYNSVGETYWIEIKISPILSEKGELIRFIAVQNNITEFVEREKEFERLAMVAQKTTNAVIITDSKGLVVWVNEGCKTLTGYSLEDFRGKKPGQLLQGKDTDPTTRMRISANLAARVSFTEKILNYDINGRAYWIELNISPIFNKRGELEGFIGVNHDIDNQVRLMATLEDLSYVARYVTNSVIIADQDGYTQWINEACERLTGYTLADFKGKKPGQLLQGPLTDPETRKRISEKLAQRLPVQEEILNYSRNGTPYWIQLNINPVYDKDGKFLKFVSVQINIDERVKREQKLTRISEEIAQNNEELRQMTEELSSAFEALRAAKDQTEEAFLYQEAIYNSLDASIITFSTEGIVIRVNETAKKWLGYDSSELIGKYRLDLPYLSPAEISKVDSELIERFGVGIKDLESNITNPAYMEAISGRVWTYRRKDNSVFFVRSSFCPIIRSDNQVLGYLIIAYDITKTKILEEQVQKQNKKLADSINYAQRIQTSIIPRATSYPGLNRDFFIINQPKNVVSGDFYWSKQLSDHEFLAICVDCTGHGVPGAMMSMLAAALLNSIVVTQQIYDPAEIIKQLDIMVRYTLGQNEYSEIRDGMDIAVCRFNIAKRELVFSSALSPIILISAKGTELLKGSKFWVGSNYFDNSEKLFENQTVSLEEDTMVYLFTDGFQSQFGGIAQGKFGIKRLKMLLSHIYHLSGQEQKNRIYQELLNWKGSEQQTDDILVVGFRV